MSHQPPNFTQEFVAYFADRLAQQQPDLVASIRALVQAGHINRVEAIADRCGNVPLALAIKCIALKQQQEINHS